MPWPPLDEFQDDSRIAEGVALLRRVPPSRVDEGRISGGAFQLQKEDEALAMGYPGRCMSLIWEELVLEHELGLDAALQKQWRGYHLARIDAGILRSWDFGLQHVPEEDDPWHVVAFPLKSVNRAKKAQSPLAMAAELVR